MFGSESTVIIPPILSEILLQIDKPRPQPFSFNDSLFLIFPKLINNLWMFSFESPIPVSFTYILIFILSFD